MSQKAIELLEEVLILVEGLRHYCNDHTSDCILVIDGIDQVLAELSKAEQETVHTCRQLESTEFIKFRKKLGEVLGIKGLLGENVPPTEFILAESDRQAAENKSFRDQLGPIREWYGGCERLDTEILADAVADLQQDRKELLEAKAKNKQFLHRT